MNLQSSRRYNQIGIDRIIRLKWLEHTAYLSLAGNEAPAVKIALQEYLQGAFRSNDRKVRGSLDKTITILMKIWLRPPPELCSLQCKGLKLLSQLPRKDRIALHWGQTCAVYPFWEAVAAYVGRLLKLQGTVTASQVQRRMQEQYGERETVSRATQRVLRSFVDWKVLKETPKKGIYTSGLSLAITQVELISWLTEAFLRAHPDGSVALRAILDSTSLFPFRISPVSADQLVAVSERLDVLRHGLDQDLIILRNN
ncbi:MAG: hypothetical protein PWP04_1410 [Candidatus Atribacteria bacterium]|nr:hypothetical protein [Candidatus Atribacteria bacterium]